MLSATAALEKKGEQVLVLEVEALTPLASYFLICSGGSGRQVLAIADAIDDVLSKQGIEPASVEGRGNAAWVLMDYHDMIVHIFLKETREFYDLERLWGDAKELSLPSLKALVMEEG